MGSIEIESKFPLMKKTNKYIDFITPKLSFKLNPNDMKNYSSADKKINADNGALKYLNVALPNVIFLKF